MRRSCSSISVPTWSSSSRRAATRCAGWTASGQDLGSADGALFQFLAASKRSAVVDLDTAPGRALLRRAAAHFDVVFESFGPGGMAARGLAPAVLQRANPRLSVVSISPFGQRGPWAERPANEWTLQAIAGSTGYRGLPERGPVGAGGQLGEWAVSPYAALGAVFAWLSARRTGLGQHVDVSQFEAVVSCLTVYHDLQGQFFPGPLPQAIETPSIEPAKDGWVGLCTYTGQQWKDLCALMGRPDVGEDERFYDGRARMEHLAFIHEVIHAWTREQTVDDIIEVAQAMRIPAAPIGDGKRVLEFDHMRERGVFVDNPGGFKQPRPPFLFGRMQTRPIGAAPVLGADTAALHALADASAEAPDAPTGEPALPLAGLRVLDLTAFLGGAGRDRDAREPRRGCDQGRVDAAARRHALCRRRAQRGDVGALAGLPRREHRQARDHPRSVERTRHRAREAADREGRRRHRELLGARDGAVRSRLGRAARAEPEAHPAADAGLGARRTVA